MHLTARILNHLTWVNNSDYNSILERIKILIPYQLQMVQEVFVLLPSL